MDLDPVSIKVSFELSKLPEHKVVIYESIDDVPFSEWNACIRKDCLFLTSDYLKVAESSSLPGMRFRYAIIYKQGAPVAILYFQLVNLSDVGLGGILNLEEYGGLAGSLSSRINDILFRPGKNKESLILVCGNLLVSGEYGISAIDDQEFNIAVETISPVKKIIAQSLPKKSRLVAFMVKDFYAHNDRIAKPLLKDDYFLLNTDPEMIFEVQSEWKNFEDYRSALSSKYRIRANNVQSKLGSVVIRELTYAEINDCSSALFQLNDQVIKKAPVKLARPSENYFMNLKAKFDSNYHINGFFLDDQLVAFTSGFWNSEHFEAHFIGIDYKYNLKHNLYQNILYSYISDAIACQSKRLYFGRTALEIKSTVGARPYHLSCYFRFANKVLNTLAKPLVSSTGPKDWIPRDPFKNKNH